MAPLVRVEQGVPVYAVLLEYLGAMQVWMRVASRNLIAVLSVWALPTPSRVLPANFSILARSAPALLRKSLASRRATAGATRYANKIAPVLVVSSVRRSILSTYPYCPSNTVFVMDRSVPPWEGLVVPTRTATLAHPA